jgi:5-methylcytosine-specific restriction protein A
MIDFIKNLFVDRTFGASRSPRWASFRREHIKDKCEVCRKGHFLELHHIKPYHLFPEEETNSDNVVTVCRSCHFSWCHFFSWKKFNSQIKSDIIRVNE